MIPGSRRMARLTPTFGGERRSHLPSIDLPNFVRHLPRERMLTRSVPRALPQAETRRAAIAESRSGLGQVVTMLAAVALGVLAQDCRCKDEQEPAFIRDTGRPAQVTDLPAELRSTLGSQDLQVRIRAFESLARWDFNSLYPGQKIQLADLVINALPDADPSIRYYATYLSRVMMDSASIPLEHKVRFISPLSERLKDAEGSIREEAAHGLRLLAGLNLSLEQALLIESRVVETLQSEDAHTYQDLFEALGKLANKYPEQMGGRTIERLKAWVLQGSGAGFRSAAGSRLASRLTEPMLDEFLNIFINGQEPQERDNAAQFFLQASSFPASLKERLVGSLTGVLGSSDPFVRRKAIEILCGLAQFPPGEVSTALERETDPVLLIKLMDHVYNRILINVFPSEFNEPLVRAAGAKLRDLDPGVKMKAILILHICAERDRALGALAQIIEPLKSALEDPQDTIRLYSARILKRIIEAGLLAPDKLDRLAQILLRRLYREEMRVICGYSRCGDYPSAIQGELADCILSLPDRIRINISTPQVIKLSRADVHEEAAPRTARTYAYDLVMFLARTPENAEFMRLYFVDPLGQRWAQNCTSWGDNACSAEAGLQRFRVFLNTNTSRVEAYFSYYGTDNEGRTVGIGRSATFHIDNPDAE